MNLATNVHFNTKHGHNGRYKDGKPQYSRTHTSWQGMKQRCDYPKSKSYKDYGGRGIAYDPSWARFEQFLTDMGERPEGTSLDRIDRNGAYSKANCRWATPLVQVQNSSAFKHGCGSDAGDKKCTKEFRVWMNVRGRCRSLGISYDLRWDTFTVFLEDVGHAPSNTHRFGRIDRSKDYTKENCIWKQVMKRDYGVS